MPGEVTNFKLAKDGQSALISKNPNVSRFSLALPPFRHLFRLTQTFHPLSRKRRKSNSGRSRPPSPRLPTRISSAASPATPKQSSTSAVGSPDRGTTSSSRGAKVRPPITLLAPHLRTPFSAVADDLVSREHRLKHLHLAPPHGRAARDPPRARARGRQRCRLAAGHARGGRGDVCELWG